MLTMADRLQTIKSPPKPEPQESSTLTLTDADEKLCIAHAYRRIHRSAASNLKRLAKGDGCPTYAIGDEIVGCIGELVVCRLLGVPLPWPDEGERPWFATYDVAGHQVRCANGPGRGLILREADGKHRGQLFILVTIDKVLASGLVCTARGFIRGEDGMSAPYLKRPDPNRPECWLVPQNALVPFSPRLLLPGY